MARASAATPNSTALGKYFAAATFPNSSGDHWGGPTNPESITFQRLTTILSTTKLEALVRARSLRSNASKPSREDIVRIRRSHNTLSAHGQATDQTASLQISIRQVGGRIAQNNTYFCRTLLHIPTRRLIPRDLLSSPHHPSYPCSVLSQVLQALRLYPHCAPRRCASQDPVWFYHSFALNLRPHGPEPSLGFCLPQSTRFVPGPTT